MRATVKSFQSKLCQGKTRTAKMDYVHRLLSNSRFLFLKSNMLTRELQL